MIKDHCDCIKVPGKVFWVDDIDNMIHDVCGKTILLHTPVAPQQTIYASIKDWTPIEAEIIEQKEIATQ